MRDSGFATLPSGRRRHLVMTPGRSRMEAPVSALDAGSSGTLHAFVSYSHADRKAAARLQSHLERYPLPAGQDRLQVFLDETDIRSGALSAKLGAALRRAQAPVVCCSPSSTESRWVEQEVDILLRQGDRPVVPIVLAGEPDTVVPAALRQRQFRYPDLRGSWWFGQPGPKGRIELARGIATLLGRPLRDLVDWERHRQQRFALASGVAAATGADMKCGEGLW
jgi:hypothetical protein